MKYLFEAACPVWAGWAWCRKTRKLNNTSCWLSVLDDDNDDDDDDGDDDDDDGDDDDGQEADFVGQEARGWWWGIWTDTTWIILLPQDHFLQKGINRNPPDFHITTSSAKGGRQVYVYHIFLPISCFFCLLNPLWIRSISTKNYIGQENQSNCVLDWRGGRIEDRSQGVSLI